MTNAYIEGFCKTAEAYGVDPQELLKTAGIGSAVGRYFELLGGGSKDLLSGRRAFMDLISRGRMHAIQNGEKNIYDMFNKYADKFKGAKAGEKFSLFDSQAGKSLEHTVSQAELDELRKVFNTRLNTGLGVTAGGIGTYLGFKPKKKKGVSDYFTDLFNRG